MAPKGSTATGVPFIDHLGARMEEAGHGSSMLILDLAPEHRNTLGAAHGGVIMTMLDVAMARAARQTARHEGEDDLRVLTIEMKTTFVQAGTGDRLLARGSTVHRSTSMCFTEAEVHDESGRLLARSSGTFKYVRPRTLSHRPPK
jgi:acyl-CoA thioesterase